MNTGLFGGSVAQLRERLSSLSISKTTYDTLAAIGAIVLTMGAMWVGLAFVQGVLF